MLQPKNRPIRIPHKVGFVFIGFLPGKAGSLAKEGQRRHQTNTVHMPRLASTRKWTKSALMGGIKQAYQPRCRRREKALPLKSRRSPRWCSARTRGQEQNRAGIAGRRRRVLQTSEDRG